MDIKKLKNLEGTLSVPGDKSISHRAVMFGSLAQGTTKISGFLEGADCLSTIRCFRKMGISVEQNGSDVLVYGKGFLEGADCLSTIRCFRKMGISVEQNGSDVLVYGKGLHGLSAPSDVLDTGNSGTTTRLISGILAGQNFSSILTGDESIQSRPILQVKTSPPSLQEMSPFSHAL